MGKFSHAVAETPEPAKALARHFAAERERLWPGASANPSNLITEWAIATGLLAEPGASPELLGHEVTRRLEWLAGQGRTAPASLASVRKAAQDGIARHRALTARGEAPRPAVPALTPEREREAWRLRLRRYWETRGSEWRHDHGAGPWTGRCAAPADLLAAIIASPPPRGWLPEREPILAAPGAPRVATG